MKPHRWLWVAAALCAVGGLLAGALPRASGHYPPAPARPCAGQTDAVLVKGAWTLIKKPAALTAVVAQAAGGLDGLTVLASDGRRVVRSADGGCTWTPSYDAGDAGPAPGTLPSVSLLAFPSGGRGRAFMVVDGIAGVVAPALLMSEDQGATWIASGSGLPAAGTFRQIVGAGEHLYVVVGTPDAVADNDPASVSGQLYGSDDGGATWTQRSTGNRIEDLAVDPVAPATIVAVLANHTVEKSTDGGRSWAALTIKTGDPDTEPASSGAVGDPGAEMSWSRVAVAHEDHQETIVVLSQKSRTAEPGRVVASNNGGGQWIELPAEGLGPATGVTFGNGPTEVLAVAGSASTSFHGPGLQAFDIGERRFRDVDFLQGDSYYGAASYPLDPATRGHSGLYAIQVRLHGAGKADAIARYSPPDPPPAGTSLTGRVECDLQASEPPAAPAVDYSAGDASAPPVDFTPETIALALKPGVASSLDLHAALTPVPSPLDVYFLIDSSTSMDPAIGGAECSARRLARDLQARGIDAWFGAATYNDIFEFRYRRLVDLSPDAERLRVALDGLNTTEGRQEPMRSGLYQTATGAGLDYSEPASVNAPSGHAYVAPGQQADYRAGALHTVITIGDEPYDTGTPAEPSREDVAAALRAKGILAIGIQVIPPTFLPPGTDTSRYLQNQLILNQQLRYFATQTGALAPPGGVDCDGSGRPTLNAGDPLVCQVNERGIDASMGDTLVTLLKSLKDVKDVRLIALKTSGLDVRIDGGVLPGVNVKDAQTLAGTLVVTCTAAQAGRRYPLTLGVEAGTRVVGTLAGAAVCGRLPVAAAVPPPKAHRHTRAPRPAPAHPRSVTPPAAQPATPPHAIVAPPPSAPPTPAPVPPAAASAPATAPAPASAPGAAAAPTPGGVAVAAAQVHDAKLQVAQADAGRVAAGEHQMTAVRGRLTTPLEQGARPRVSLPPGALAAARARRAPVTAGPAFVLFLAAFVFGGAGSFLAGRRSRALVPKPARQRF